MTKSLKPFKSHFTPYAVRIACSIQASFQMKTEDCTYGE